MRFARLLPFVLVLPIAGCKSPAPPTAQFTVTFDLEPNPIDVTSLGVLPLHVDLNTVREYSDHKENLKDVADAALLGEITNTSANTAQLDFYMTTDLTTYNLASQVLADTSKVQVWGTLTLAPDETRVIDWDESAGLFKGRQALLDQMKGDGQFTLYAIVTPGATARIADGALVVIIEAGI